MDHARKGNLKGIEWAGEDPRIPLEPYHSYIYPYTNSSTDPATASYNERDDVF